MCVSLGVGADSDSLPRSVRYLSLSREQMVPGKEAIDRSNQARGSDRGGMVIRRCTNLKEWKEEALGGVVDATCS